MVIQFVGRTLLHDMPILEQHDVIGHGHGLGLVMGYIDGGNSELELNFLQLVAHLIAQLGIQVAQRLVQQKHLRIAHQGASQRHALALAAGKLGRAAVQKLLDGEHPGHVIHPLVDFLLGGLLGFQGKGHVFTDGHVGIQRVFLKYHGDVTLLRGHKGLVPASFAHAGHHVVPKADFAVHGMQQPGDAVHRRGFSAARRPKKHAELAVLHLKVQLIQHVGFAPVVGHAHILNTDGSHMITFLKTAIGNSLPEGRASEKLRSASPKRLSH